MTSRATWDFVNAIAVAEAQAHDYLVVWADATPSPDVRKVLLTVAAREGEHGMSFAKRINELGYEVRGKDDSELQKSMALVKSDRSGPQEDGEAGLHRLDTGDQPDVFDGLFKDHSIDIRTGELLGRYIAEERDTAATVAKLLRAARRGRERQPRGPVVRRAHLARGQGRRAVRRGRRAPSDRVRADDADERSQDRSRFSVLTFGDARGRRR